MKKPHETPAPPEKGGSWERELRVWIINLHGKPFDPDAFIAQHKGAFTLHRREVRRAADRILQEQQSGAAPEQVAARIITKAQGTAKGILDDAAAEARRLKGETNEECRQKRAEADKLAETTIVSSQIDAAELRRRAGTDVLNANREAEQILANARTEAERILAEARTEAGRIAENGASEAYLIFGEAETPASAQRGDADSRSAAAMRLQQSADARDREVAAKETAWRSYRKATIIWIWVAVTITIVMGILVVVKLSSH